MNYFGGEQGESKVCIEAVTQRGYGHRHTIRSQRDRAKLNWLDTLASMPERIYPKQLLKIMNDGKLNFMREDLKKL